MSLEEFWQEFIQKAGIDKATNYITSFYFDDDEATANELLVLVEKGIKRATASSVSSYTLANEKLPEVGDYNIITDWAGVPHCVIKTTGVTILPFNEMSYEMASREGEDENLESWVIGHRKFFMSEAADMGYEFKEDMDIVFEDFIVVYKA